MEYFYYRDSIKEIKQFVAEYNEFSEAAKIIIKKYIDSYRVNRFDTNYHPEGNSITFNLYGLEIEIKAEFEYQKTHDGNFWHGAINTYLILDKEQGKELLTSYLFYVENEKIELIQKRLEGMETIPDSSLNLDTFPEHCNTNLIHALMNRGKEGKITIAL